MTSLENPTAEVAVSLRPIIEAARATQPTADSSMDLLTIENREKEITALLNDYLRSLRKIEEECSRLYGSPLEPKSDPVKPAF